MNELKKIISTLTNAHKASAAGYDNKGDCVRYIEEALHALIAFAASLVKEGEQKGSEGDPSGPGSAPLADRSASLRESQGATIPVATQACEVLDACCGGRMFWYTKENGRVLYMDKRRVEKGAFANGWNPNWCVDPDVVADFRSMPFPDKSFKLIVYDPPHLIRGSEKGVINMKYGILDKQTWRSDIVAGFNECWRCLDECGTLIFKWNDADIKALELVKDFPVEPMFGDFTGKSGLTRWMTFYKPSTARVAQGIDAEILEGEAREIGAKSPVAVLSDAPNPSPATSLIDAGDAMEPVAYCPAYELERLKIGCSAHVRSTKFGPSELDGDVPLYTHPTKTSVVQPKGPTAEQIMESMQEWAEHYFDMDLDENGRMKADLRTRLEELMKTK